MSFIYAFTHTFASYALFGGLFIYLAFLVFTKLLGYRGTKVKSRFMWLALIIPFITYFSLQVFFPQIDYYQEHLLRGTPLHALVKWACQVGYWTSLVLTPLIFVWGTIIAVRLTYVFLSGRKFRQANTPARETEHPQLFRVVNDLARQLRINMPEVYILDRGWADCFTFGCIRSAIVIDRSLLDLGSGEIKAVVAHELAHVYRKDTFWSLATIVLRDLMFFSPAAHWAYSGILTVKEEMADDIAVDLMGDRLQYGHALIKVWKRMNCTGFSHQPNVYPVLGLVQGNLAHRVERIVNPSPRRTTPILSLLLLGVLVIGLLSFIC